MSKQKNIYSFQLHHSYDEETHYLLTKGRIGLSVFLNRIILSFVFLAFLNLIHFLYWDPLYHEIFRFGKIINVSKYSNFLIWKTFYLFLSPVIISTFIIIQCVKRLHDVDKPALYLLVPIYNIALLILPGTIGKNNYGQDPSPKKNVIYYDELEYSEPVQSSKRTLNEIIKLYSTFILIIFVVNQFTQYPIYRDADSNLSTTKTTKNPIKIIDNVSKRDYINLGIPPTVLKAEQLIVPIQKIYPRKQVNIVFKSSLDELNKAILNQSIDIILAPFDDISIINKNLLVSNTFSPKQSSHKLCFLIPQENTYFLRLLNSNIKYIN